MSSIEFTNPLDMESVSDLPPSISNSVSGAGSVSPVPPRLNSNKKASLFSQTSFFTRSKSSSSSPPPSPSFSTSTSALSSSNSSRALNGIRTSIDKQEMKSPRNKAAIMKKLVITGSEREKLVNLYGAQVKKFEKEAKELFLSDANENGELEAQEFCKFTGFLGIRNHRLSTLFFAVIDDNQSGTIEFHELLNFLLLIHCGTEEDKLSFGFRLMDRDMDGVLSYEDLSSSIQDLYSVVLCDENTNTAQEVAKFVDTVFEEMATLPTQSQTEKSSESKTSESEISNGNQVERPKSNKLNINTSSTRVVNGRIAPSNRERHSILFNNEGFGLNECRVSPEAKRITWQSFRAKAKGMEIYLRTLGAQASTLNKPQLRANSPDSNSLFGERYRFILTMMLGIESAIRRINLIQSGKDDLAEEDDDDDDDDAHSGSTSSNGGNFEKDHTNSVTKETFRIPTSDGSFFRITSYGADDFRAIREGFGLTNDEFLISVGIRQVVGSLIMGDMFSLNEQISEGKSGSLFFWTKDGQYMIKTISRSESHVMRKTLKSYRDHLKGHPNSLLMKILGLYRLKTQGEKYEIIIMQNVFETSVHIDERFDIKGSSYLRTVGVENRCKPGLVMKDSDFVELDRYLEVGKLGQQLGDIIKADARYLASNSIIDYSFLVGVHIRNKKVLEEEWKKGNEEQLKQLYQEFEEIKGSFFQKSMDFDTFAHYAFLHESNVLLSTDKYTKSNDNENFIGGDGEALYNWRKGYAVPSKGEGEDEVILFFGIIDTLVPFDTKKYSEYMVKSVIQHGKNFSVIPPQKYADRFINFLVNLIR